MRVGTLHFMSVKAKPDPTTRLSIQAGHPRFSDDRVLNNPVE